MTARNRRSGRRRDGPADESPPEPTTDETFTLLRSVRGRTVLRRLRTTPETTLSDLADHLTAAETGAGDTPDAGERKRVYISLYQSHLPALADAGVVAYDRDGGEVRRLAAADRLDRHLDRFDGTGPGSTARAGAYAIVAAGLVVVAGAAGVAPFGAVDPAWWALVGVVALAARYRSERS